VHSPNHILRHDSLNVSQVPSLVISAMTADWLAARAELETRFQAALTNDLPLLPQLHAVVLSAFPEAAALLADAAAATGSHEGGGEDGGGVGGGGDEKAGALDRQLVEHCLFRVLGVCHVNSARSFLSTHTALAPGSADGLMRAALQAEEGLMERSGPRVLRALDSALVLCQECVAGGRTTG